MQINIQFLRSEVLQSHDIALRLLRPSLLAMTKTREFRVMMGNTGSRLNGLCYNLVAYRHEFIPYSVIASEARQPEYPTLRLLRSSARNNKKAGIVTRYV